jgi:hypothetical protein
MSIYNISFKSALETMDHVPVISTVKNLGDIFAKCVWRPDLETLSTHAKTYYEHIIDKSYLRCVLLLIPVIGNLLVWVMDLETETEDEAIKKDQDICDTIKSTIRVALLHVGASFSGAGSTDTPIFSSTFSFVIRIQKNDVMKSVNGNGRLELDEKLLNLQMRVIQAAVADLHKRFGKEALDCFHVPGEENTVAIVFPSVRKLNILRTLQTGSHNHPVILADSSQIVTV